MAELKPGASAPSTGAWARRLRAPWLGAAAMIAILAASTQASAITVVDTYEGTILTNVQVANYYPGNSNNDRTGIFGAASLTGADIAGQAFKAVVTTNIALAPQTTVDPTTHEVDSVDATTPDSISFSSVTLTINGVSVSWSENYGSNSLPSKVSEGGEFQESLLYYESETCCAGNTFAAQVTADPLFSFDFPYSLSAPGTYDVQYTGDITDLFTIQVSNPGPLVYTRGFLDPTSLTVSVLGAPEPSAWVMMLAGVGALGAVVRRRRQTSGAAPA